MGSYQIYTALKTEEVNLVLLCNKVLGWCEKGSVLLINAIEKGTCSNFLIVVASPQNVKLAERAGSID